MKIFLIGAILFALGTVSFAESYNNDYVSPPDAGYTEVVGACGVHKINNKISLKNLTAKFYIRPEDSFKFEYTDANGDVYEDPSLYRSHMYTGEYKILMRSGKVRIKERESYFKATFEFDIKRKTAKFQHGSYCGKHKEDGWLAPCREELSYERYEVTFKDCDLNFENFLD